MNGCKHLEVDAYIHRYPGTYFEPDEYTGWGRCANDDCGEVFNDLDDIPEGSEVKEHSE